MVELVDMEIEVAMDCQEILAVLAINRWKPILGVVNRTEQAVTDRRGVPEENKVRDEVRHLRRNCVVIIDSVVPNLPTRGVLGVNRITHEGCGPNAAFLVMVNVETFGAIDAK